MRLRTGSATRRGTLVALLVLCLGIGLVPGIAQATSQAEYRTKLLAIINRARTNHGERPVKINLRLSRDALKHTNKMVSQQRLYDPPHLYQLLAPYQWDDLGADVVGCDDTMLDIHRGFMSEKPHRDIILYPKLRRVGLGIVKTTGKSRCGRNSIWVTEIYYG